MKYRLWYEVRQMMKSKNYIIAVLLSLCLSFYFLFTCVSDRRNVFTNYLGNATGVWFVFSIIIITLIISNKIFDEIRVNYNYLIRFQTKRKAYSNFIKIEIILNVILLLVTYLIPLFLLIITKKMPVEVIKYNNYSINYVIYIIYYLIKVIFLINVLNLMFFAIRWLTSKRIAYIVYGTLLIFIPLSITNLEVITGLSNMYINPKYYFMIMTYSHFILEISIFIFYICILILIFNLLINIFYKINKDLI